ncbi:MAG: LysR family transcriptional regulator [Deltaproteobacteria bacterium]|nr:LysR family transcriptional regulator [Deltaproteobacteria bacterium]
MDLVLLESLLAVAQHKTVTGAARALAITQPALTRRLQQLEETLGAPLLERSKRGAALTDSGRLVAEEGRQLVERYGRLREAVRAREELQAGIVRLGGGAAAVSFVLPTTIAEFGRQYPGVRFEVREEGSRAVEEDVLAERLELGIVTLPTRSRELEVRPLRRDRVVLIAAPSHPLARRRRLEAADLQGQGLVGFESESAIRRLIDDALREAGVAMKVQMELRSFAAILEMVRHTSMLAFVSQLGVEGRGRELGVRVLEVRGLSIHRRLAVIHKLGRPLSPAARAFSAMVR